MVHDPRNLPEISGKLQNLHMQLRCLLVGLDDVNVRPVRTALNTMAIRCEYVTYSGAPERVQRGRYEAIVLSYDGSPSAADLVQKIRSGVSNRDAVIFLLSSPASQHTAFRVRANFFMNPPITDQSVITTFKAAYGLLVRSRSRWHREPVTATAHLNLGLVKNVPANIVNLSQGGMSLSCGQVLRPQQLLLVRFGLPGTAELLCVSGVVIWTRADGSAGIRFAEVAAPTQKVLRDWVEERLELAKVYAVFREKTGTLGQASL